MDNFSIQHETKDDSSTKFKKEQGKPKNQRKPKTMLQKTKKTIEQKPKKLKTPKKPILWARTKEVLDFAFVHKIVFLGFF